MLIKVSLKLNVIFTYIYCQKWQLSFKKKSIFIVLSILKNCSRRMKHMSLIAEKIGHTFRNSIKKNQLFISNLSRVLMKRFNEVLQPRFFAKKMT
jgi:hypothetical protein